MLAGPNAAKRRVCKRYPIVSALCQREVGVVLDVEKLAAIALRQEDRKHGTARSRRASVVHDVDRCFSRVGFVIEKIAEGRLAGRCTRKKSLNSQTLGCAVQEIVSCRLSSGGAAQRHRHCQPSKLNRHSSHCSHCGEKGGRSSADQCGMFSVRRMKSATLSWISFSDA